MVVGNTKCCSKRPRRRNSTYSRSPIFIFLSLAAFFPEQCLSFNSVVQHSKRIHSGPVFFSGAVVDGDVTSNRQRYGNLQKDASSCREVQGNLFASRRLSKKIWSCGSDWELALNLLYEAYPFFISQPTAPYKQGAECQLDGKSISATIEVLGKSGRFTDALRLTERATELYAILSLRANNNASAQLEADMRMCYRSCISAAGNCGRFRVGFKLLHEIMPQRTGLSPTVDAYHALIAACGRCGAVEAALLLVTEMESGRMLLCDAAAETRVPPKADRLAYVTAITACSQNRRCDEAAKILHRMRKYGVDPDISTYHQVLSAYSKLGGRHKDALRLLETIEADEITKPNNSTYNIVISCCGKDGAWDDVKRIMERSGLLDEGQNSKNIALQASKISEGKFEAYGYSDYFTDLNLFQRRGKGKDRFWEIGRYHQDDSIQPIIIGIQPNRNPIRNGVSLVFYDAQTDEKVGFMLLRHKAKTYRNKEQLFSAIIGMLVTEKYRGKGFSSLFVAIWVQMCLDIDAFPRAEKMKKPLISLALDRFGFLPQKGGVEIEISPIGNVRYGHDFAEPSWGADVALFSPTGQALEGLYRERDLRVQRMILSRHAPKPRGKLVYVGTGFHHPVFSGDFEDARTNSKAQLCKCIDSTIGNGSLAFHGDFDLIRRAAFGFIRTRLQNDS